MKAKIWLPLTEAKCIGASCKHPIPCARRDIAMEKGRPLTDYSVGRYIPDCCAPKWGKHMPYSQAVKPEQERPVKEWIGQ